MGAGSPVRRETKLLQVATKHRITWDEGAGQSQPISILPLHRGPLSDKRIFTIGSCFALEIRHELTDMGYSTYPRYLDIEFDSERVAISQLPERDNVNHYNIASILQEFENIASDTPIFLSDYFYDFSGSSADVAMIKRVARTIVSSNGARFEANWQDPFRQHLYAENRELLEAASAAVTEKIREGAETADVFVVTLGMSEIWVDKKSGLAVCNGYGRKIDGHLCDFVDLSSTQTIEMTTRLVEIIQGINRHADIIFSVSPVPLKRTAKSES